MGAGGDAVGDHAYFQAIEETFVRLRGAPLLLSPADWHLAREWHRRGIPLELVQRCLEELFERRRERGDEGKVRNLRYCARAVEAAWREVEEMTAPGRRQVAEEGLDVAPRLRALAAALPPELTGRAELQARITALEGSAEAVESRLRELDDELLDTLEEGLRPELRAAVEEAIREALQHLAERLPADELAAVRRRLRRRELRRRRELPVLSLFSPEARAGAGAGRDRAEEGAGEEGAEEGAGEEGAEEGRSAGPAAEGDAR